MTTLRPYQQAAVDAVFDYWAKGGPGSPLVELPTGAGKSLVLAAICRRLVEEFGTRVVVATHRKELIEQDARAIRSFWPAAPVGIFSAGLFSKRIDTITVGGIQSLVPHLRKARMQSPGVLIIDEAHLLAPEDGTGYRLFIAAMREQNPDMRLVGLTATPYRLGQGLLTSGEDALFSCIAYRADVLSLVADGFLSPLVSPSTALRQIDTSNVAVRGGEYVARDLELASDLAEVNSAVARDVAGALAAGRTSALVFGTSINHAQHLAEELAGAGVRAQVVTGETSPLERAGALAAFKDRRLACICSCDVLTTGFDAPCTDVIALVRPTQSPGLYVQMVGRGMRLAAGKSDCLLLDYGGNVARHGPISAIRLPPPPRRTGSGSGATKRCPSCHADAPVAARVCVHCDHEFPAPEVEKHANSSASSLDPMRDANPVRQYDVAGVSCRVHKSRSSGKDTLRVDFLDENALPLASEYVCLEHDGFARSKAERWWSAFFPACALPSTCAEGVEFWRAGLMRPVLSITVVPDGKYQRVKSVDFAPPPSIPISDVFAGDEIPF